MYLVEVKNASFSYDNKRYIFENLDLTLSKGEVLCVIGPNGCGKTTLIDCILGMNKLQNGEITIEGTPISDIKPREFAEKMSFVPQGHKSTFSYTVLDVVTMGRTYATRMFIPPGAKEKELARKALIRVGLEGFEDREYTRLSGGELQLVMVARALAQQSKVMVLDEPTAHLDFSHELNVMETLSGLIKENNMSMIMSTHFLNQAYFLENAGVNTKVALMQDGGFIKTGKPSEVLTSEILENSFDIMTEIVKDGGGERKYILPIRKKKTYRE